MALKDLKIPHVFALLTIVIFICSLLTYVIPSGEYRRETKKINNSERTLVIPGTYQTLDKDFSAQGFFLGGKTEEKASPVGLYGFLTAIPRGMEKAGDIIFFIFMIGGVFGILRQTGTIDAAIHMLLAASTSLQRLLRLKDKGPLLTIVLMTALALCGSTLGMGEEFIPLVPVFLLVSKKLGYDRIYGMALVIVAAQVGFAAATTNPFTVVIAQGIAELPLNSAIGFRLIFFACCITVTLIYMLRYGAKVKNDPSASIMADDDFDLGGQQADDGTYSGRHMVIILVSLAIFGLILYATVNLGWWMSDMAGGFFLMGILAMIIARMSLTEATKAFVKGMEDMVVAALVVGFARGIEIVLSDSQTMDTLIYGAALVLKEVPNYVGVQGMLIFQSMLNLIIPSGSGQAAVTMPLMAPLADVIGLTRQTAVFAFQCGDGFSNTIIPTSGILMSMLSLARIPYEKWLRFMTPLFLQLLVLSGIFLAIAVAVKLQ